MKLLQNNVLRGNKLNCGDPTHILIWASEIAKSPTRQIKGRPGDLVSRGGGVNLGGDLKF